MTNKPLITVITVVFNGAEFLEETINSIINQTYSNIEYIIIDGGSKDETLDIIKKNEHSIAYWVSDPDKGIYDAMNKGISKSSGDWINFMNVGDLFANNEVLEKLFSGEKIDADILAGDTLIDYNSFVRYSEVKELQLINRGMLFCHQSSFVRGVIYRENHFDLSYKIASDFNFFYSCFIHRRQFKIFDFPFSKVTSGGVSDKERYKTLFEYRKIVLSYSNASMKIKLIYLFMFLQTFISLTLVKILPMNLVVWLKKKRWNV